MLGTFMKGVLTKAKIRAHKVREDREERRRRFMAPKKTEGPQPWSWK